MESVSAHGTQTPMRGAFVLWLDTWGAAATLVKSTPNSVAVLRRAGGKLSCERRIQEPAGKSLSPTRKDFSAISISNPESLYRAANKPSWPVSFRRNIGPEPETLPAGCGSSFRGVRAEAWIEGSAIGMAFR